MSNSSPSYKLYIAILHDLMCSYLVSFLLDSTAGLFIIFLLLKAVAWLVAVFDLSPLRSGVYGNNYLCVFRL